MLRAYRFRAVREFEIEAATEAEALEKGASALAFTRSMGPDSHETAEVEAVVCTDWLPLELRKAARLARWYPRRRRAVAGAWASDGVVALRAAARPRWSPIGVVAVEAFGFELPEYSETVELDRVDGGEVLRGAGASVSCDPEYLELVAAAFPRARARIRLGPRGEPPGYAEPVFFFDRARCVAILMQRWPEGAEAVR